MSLGGSGRFGRKRSSGATGEGEGCEDQNAHGARKLAEMLCKPKVESRAAYNLPLVLVRKILAMETVKLMAMRYSLAILPLMTALATACSSLPRQPPGSPPSPESISREDPGGDAHDPHLAALSRLIDEPWGFRSDKEEALRIPMPDARNWRRVRFFGVPALAAFRYGDDHHAVIGVWVRPSEAGEEDDLESCLNRFEAWGKPMARRFRVQAKPGESIELRWRREPILARSLEAKVNSWLSKKTYAAAYAAYPMWPGTCSIIGLAVASRGSEAEAQEVRDRYIHEGFRRLIRKMRVPPIQ